MISTKPDRSERPRLLPLALLLTLLPVHACTKRDGSPAASEHEAAPAFETKNLRGDKVSLADYEGQVVLLNTWATWCDPCVRELPELARLHTELEPKGFTVIGLNADVRTKLPEVRAMVARHELPFPIWLDFDNQAQVAFKLRGYPTSFLIDRKGMIRWKREGEIQKNDAELGRVLETVLAE